MLSLPVLPLAEPLDGIYQPQQNGDLNQRPNSSRQRLITIHAERRNRHRNRQLEVVACRREALRTGQLIPKATPAGDEQSRQEDDGKVYDQRSSDPDDGYNLMHDVSTLRGEQDQDCEEQADQRPGTEPLEKLLIIPLRADQTAQPEACDDRCAEWDTEENADTLRCYIIPQPGDVALIAEDLDEEDGDWREEDHL